MFRISVGVTGCCPYFKSMSLLLYVTCICLVLCGGGGRFSCDFVVYVVLCVFFLALQASELVKLLIVFWPVYIRVFVCLCSSSFTST